MVEPPNLFAQQETNRRRSRWLVAGFILFFAWLGFLLFLVLERKSVILSPPQFLIAQAIVVAELKDANPIVRWTAGAALVRISPADAVPAVPLFAAALRGTD